MTRWIAAAISSALVALYEALFRRLPFAGLTIAEQAANVLSGRLLRPRPEARSRPHSLAPDARPGVEPAERFPSMAELLLALDAEADPDAAVSQAVRRRTFSMIW